MTCSVLVLVVSGAFGAGGGSLVAATCCADRTVRARGLPDVAGVVAWRALNANAAGGSNAVEGFALGAALARIPAVWDPAAVGTG